MRNIQQAGKAACTELFAYPQ